MVVFGTVERTTMINKNFVSGTLLSNLCVKSFLFVQVKMTHTAHDRKSKL